MNWEVLTMKSSALSSDLTILRRDLTRFAPVWLVLCAWLLLWGWDIATAEYYYLNVYEPTAPVLAPVCALCLYGYLTKPSECVMVHSLPIRRERLFVLHGLAALLMFLIPTALFCVVMEPMLNQAAGVRFLWTGLEFVFLFAIGVLCMMLTGTKLGAGLLYVFVQCLSLILAVFLDVLYLPKLPGVWLDSELMLLSPSLVVNTYADLISDRPMNAEDWGFAAVILVLTVLLLAAAVLLYRRRKLEHAGDLLAVQWLNPVFAVCSGVTGAAAMHVLFALELQWPIVTFGIVIGYLGYWMLSKRSARVFTPKILAGLACLIAVILGSVHVVGLDPFGLVRYVPQPETVVKATLGEGTYYSDDAYATADPEQIADLEALQMDMLEAFQAAGVAAYSPADGSPIHFTYELENGRTIQRQYIIREPALLKRAAWYLSQPEALFRTADPKIRSIYARVDNQTLDLIPVDGLEFAQILLEDCRAGRMYSFDPEAYTGLSVSVEVSGYHYHVPIPSTAEKTIAWLEENCKGVS